MYPGVVSDSRLLIRLVFLVLLFVFAVPDKGFALVQTVLPRYYTLNSLLSLTYERNWTSTASFDRFAYGLNVNFTGFVIDPRLISLNIGGNFTQDFNSMSNSTMDGIAVTVSLLNERPKRGFLHYVPQPIELRYEYDSYELGSHQNYGISFIYRPERKLPAYVEDFSATDKTKNTGEGNQGGNNQNAGDEQNIGNQQQQKKVRIKKGFFSFIPQPTFYLDYDRYESDTPTGKRTHDRFDLRAEARERPVEYLAEYRYDSYNNSANSVQYLSLQTNLHYYWKESMSRLDSYNLVYLQDTGIESSLAASSTTAWVKNLGPAGRDSVFVSGGGLYLSRESKNEYGLRLSGGYNKFHSSRFVNFASATVAYDKTDEDSQHNETFQNNLTYRISDYLVFQNRLSAGMNSSGPLYGILAGFQIGRRYIISPSVDFQYSEGDNGEQSKIGTLSLDLTAPLLRQMNFYSQNYYRITDVTGGFAPHRDETLSSSSSIFWTISRYTLSLGVSYISGSTDGISMGDVPLGNDTKSTTTITAGLATYLARRLNLYVSAYYQKDNDSEARIIVTPLLTWQWRRVTVTARYTYNRLENSNVEHRLYFRVTRQFQNILRPFM